MTTYTNNAALIKTFLEALNKDPTHSSVYHIGIETKGDNWAGPFIAEIEDAGLQVALPNFQNVAGERIAIAVWKRCDHARVFWQDIVDCTGGFRKLDFTKSFAKGLANSVALFGASDAHDHVAIEADNMDTVTHLVTKLSRKFGQCFLKSTVFTRGPGTFWTRDDGKLEFYCFVMSPEMHKSIFALPAAQMTPPDSATNNTDNVDKKETK